MGQRAVSDRTPNGDLRDPPGIVFQFLSVHKAGLPCPSAFKSSILSLTHHLKSEL